MEVEEFVMTRIGFSWLLPLLLAPQLAQEPGLPKQADVALDEILKNLDSEDAHRRDAAQKQLDELYAQYGAPLITALKTRSVGAPIQVKASIDVFLAYRDR